LDRNRWFGWSILGRHRLRLMRVRMLLVLASGFLRVRHDEQRSGVFSLRIAMRAASMDRRYHVFDCEHVVKRDRQHENREDA
jgi:hypothetical protein